MPPLTGNWEKALRDEFKKPYYKELFDFVKSEYKSGVVYPPAGEIFSAFQTTDLGNIKVVILGQDPYHGPGQAHGMCFSVKPGIPAPPSLVNIFKELHDDLGVDIPKEGYLGKWAEQGVFLLNAVLTVRAHQANSHQNRGWELFTDAVIKAINNEDRPIVFLLWGAPAQRKAALLDNKKHLILKAPHPSPLSAYRGFFGCRHFSRANEFLRENGVEPVDWSLPAGTM